MEKAAQKMQNIKSRGFSLIELLVAFTLISIITGVGIASFSDYSRSQIIVQSSDNVKLNLELARSNATSSVKPAICGSDDALSAYKINFCHNLSCITGDADYEMTVVCGGAENVLQAFELPENVSMRDVEGGSGDCNTITFNIISGTVDGANCELELEGYGNSKYILIDTLGGASVNNVASGG